MKIEAKIPVTSIQGEPRALVHERAPRRRSRDEDASESSFDETLNQEQQKQAQHGCAEDDARHQAARARLALLGESLRMLDERLLGATLPALLRAQPDLMWMAQELLWVVDDLQHGNQLAETDRHQALHVLTRLRNEYAFLQARSGQRLTLQLGELFDAIERRLVPLE